MFEKNFSPLYDFAFAQIFGEQRNIENTKGFLKALLNIPDNEFGSLTVVNPILRRFFKKDKSGIVDLKFTAKSGKVIHIELQVEKRDNMKNRVMYYGARLIGDQLKWGEDYNELHQVISIVICDHVLLEEEPSYINFYELRNEANRPFTDLFKLAIMELPKLPEEDGSKLWPWLRFLKSTRKEEFEMLAKRYPELEKPVYCAKRLSLREEWRDFWFHEHLRRMDERALKKQWHIDGRAEGRVEGLAEGIQQEKMETARKMKALGYSAQQIAEITGISADNASVPDAKIS
jgi:predicted transposase/invertase (TIGR01784 family)